MGTLLWSILTICIFYTIKCDTIYKDGVSLVNKNIKNILFK